MDNLKEDQRICHELYSVCLRFDTMDLFHEGESRDESYSGCGLPEFLVHSIEQLLEGERKVNAGEHYLGWDMDWCELNADIGTCEVEQYISHRQASYLRRKYLGMER